MGTATAPPPPPPKGPERKAFWASFNAKVLAAGGSAAAIAGVLALGTTVFSWFGSEEAKITSLELGRVTPLTYGEWRDHERVPRDGVPEQQLRAPGKMIAFDVETEGFSADVPIPVRIILHDITNARSQEFEADSIKVDAGETCGCFEWVPVPRGDLKYYLEVALYPPGEIEGQPVRSVVTQDFSGLPIDPTDS